MSNGIPGVTVHPRCRRGTISRQESLLLTRQGIQVMNLSSGSRSKVGCCLLHPPPEPFNQEGLPKLGNIIIDLFNPYVMGGGDMRD